MKDYRAIYNTKKYEGMMYDFPAKSDSHAIKYANIKFAPEAQSSLRLYQGNREIPYTYNAHEEMSRREKESFVNAKYVK